MINWTDRQREIRALAVRIGERISADGVGKDDISAFPWEHWKTIKASGILGLPFDSRWGGLGADAPTVLYALEGLGYASPDAGLNFAVSTHIVSTGIPLELYGSKALKDAYLPRVCDGTMIGAHAITEPEAGSDTAGMQTMATPDGDSFVITGTKQFVSNGPIADAFVVYAKAGTPAGDPSMTAFLVPKDTEGLNADGHLQTMGLRSCPLGTLRLDHCRVPRSNVIGEVGAGFFILDQVLKWEVLCSFAMTAGEMQRRLERTIEYARHRRQFGRRLADFQSLSHKVADMHITVATARKWLFDTAERLAAGNDVTADVAISKIIASEGNLQTALTALHICGGYGYLTENGLERGVRDAVAGPIYSGTSEIQRNRIAAMLGL